MPIRIAIVLLVLGIAWLLAGLQLTLLLDRCFTIRTVHLPASRAEYDGGGLRIGDLMMTFAGTNNLQSGIRVTADSAKRAVLVVSDTVFPLGPFTGTLYLTPEPGDVVSFTVSQSLLSWPTWFEFKILGGRSPWWKRYAYYRLAWTKPSGAKLEMVWRYEQQYYSGRGWTKPEMMWNSQTGLLSVNIQPASLVPEEVVVEYVSRTKGWKRGDYRIERRGQSTDGSNDVFAVVYLADERSTHPGTGKSVEVYVDCTSRAITKELGGQ